MPEAITKFAINSSLGTENFEPLDKKIDNLFRMVASDEVYYNFDNFRLDGTKEPFSVEGYHPTKIKMVRGGTAKLSGNLYVRTYQSSAVFNVYKNGEIIYTINKKAGADGGDFPFTINIDFKVGDIFSFYLFLNSKVTTSSASHATLEKFKMLGSIVQNAFIEV